MRLFRARWRFVALVVFTLALGVAATTVLFAVVHAALIRPLPWPDADRLVRLHHPGLETPVSWPHWQGLSDAPVLEDVTASRLVLTSWLYGAARDETVAVMHASSTLVSLYRLRPVLGRFFTTEEDLERRYVVVLTDRAWRSRFGARPDVLGQIVLLGFSSPSATQEPYEVIGVMPPEFSLVSDAPEFILPAGWFHRAARLPGDHLFSVTARLVPGISLPPAQSLVDVALEQAHAAAVATDSRLAGRVNTPLELRTLDAVLRGDRVVPLALIFAASALLLLVCCAAVAGLVLEQLRQRRHELAVHQALGATWWRLARPLLFAHAAIGLAGGLAGLLLSFWALPLVNAWVPPGLVLYGDIAVNLPVSAFAVATGVAAMLLSCTIALWSSLLAPLSDLLKDSGAGAGRSRFVMQRRVVAVELGLALILVVSATLMGETLMRITASPAGFDSDRLALLSFRLTAIPPPPPGVAVTAAELDLRALTMVEGVSQQVTDVLDHLRVVPRVRQVASASAVPYWKPLSDHTITAAGDAQSFHVKHMAVSLDYFTTMRIRLVEGRTFERVDAMGRYAVVSREFERRVFGQGALGRQFTASRTAALGPYTVIGVVGDVRTSSRTSAEPVYYRLSPAATNHLVVRVDGDPAAMLPDLRAAIRAADPHMAINDVSTMDIQMAETLALDRLRVALAGGLGGLALLLAALGVYGLMARMVADRRRELGIRIIMGATGRDLYALLIRDAGGMVAWGLIVGLPGAILTAFALRGVLFGVSPASVHVYIVSAGVLAAASLAAVLLPARRAARVDPAVELRQ
jgi:putative ABC transport system permease protein